jgi:hypothetical protein
MLDPHATNPRCFVALKTYNLTREVQRVIDSADWRTNIMAISSLPGWGEPWVQANVANKHFGTHQICSYKKDVWFEITKGKGFPLFGDYGSDDPWACGLRERTRVQDITLPNECMAIHQWHPPFQYWQAKGRGPKLNKFAHTMSNYMNDTSGHVPDGGTCVIWDGGSHAELSDEEKAEWKKLDADVLEFGTLPSIVV